MILYAPEPSETATLLFSMRASLAASTVTPGSTAPDESFTTPAIALWAWATDGSASRHTSAARPKQTFLIIRSSLTVDPRKRRELPAEVRELQPNRKETEISL